MRTEVAGYYRFEAVYPDGRVEVLRDWTNNLIVDQGFDYFYTGGDGGRWYDYCSLGTGTTGPADTDTQIQTFIAAKFRDAGTISGIAYNIYPYYGFIRWVYLFPVGAVTTFYEVGVGCLNDGTKLTSRIVLRDADGGLAPITVPATAELRINYDFRIYPSLEDTTQEFTLSGVDIVATIRAANVNTNPGSIGHQLDSWEPFAAGLVFGFILPTGTTWYVSYLDHTRQGIYSGAIGDIFSSPSGSRTAGVSTEVHPYTNGQWYRDFTTTFPTGATPVQSMLFLTTAGLWQIQFDPAIPRDTLGGVKFTMRHSIGRYISNIIPYEYKENLESDLTVQSVTLT